MKGWGTALIKDIKSRGYVEVNGVLYPPNSIQALSIATKPKKRTKVLKTGGIDDTRNIKNKEKYNDPFIQFVKQELGIELWPEFYFCTDRLFRIDYAIPEFKIAIEQEGGIFMKGNSGHSSGTGIARDMEKNNLLVSMGWRLIRRQPSEMLTIETISLLKQILS
ncbi:hypothetical protein [Sphingobacterium psychroaquaticum]|uniref:Uncharacterized protein n=1 Tax=Sphingobacterium psychroaquaticum TaxID=561061 RepID=A0A1X7JVI4_9SPHI|nr:hypothetical protein [Sphingobacterium psychroaquaticum]SMG32413.1 hypothetical protein SAMN05660862_2245 [Sphingobacterium psychroaquaticum]